MRDIDLTTLVLPRRSRLECVSIANLFSKCPKKNIAISLKIVLGICSVVWIRSVWQTTKRNGSFSCEVGQPPVGMKVYTPPSTNY